MTENDKPGSKTAATDESPEAPEGTAGEPAAAPAARDAADPARGARDETATPDTPPATRGAGRGTTVLAWLAFLVSLGVAGYVGYQWWLERGVTEDDDAAELQSAIGSVRDATRANAQALSENARAVSDNTQKLADIEGTLSSVRRSLDQASQTVPAGLREQVSEQVLEEVRGQVMEGVSEQIRQQAVATDRVARLEQQVDGNRDLLESLPARMDELEQRLDGDRGVLQSLPGRIDALEQQIDGNREVLESLPRRMGDLEESMAGLQVESADARRDWLLGEAEHYMELANAQAQLAGNADLAALALGLADRRLRELDDPAYTSVRGKLSEEITALEAVENIDVAGVALSLASLAGVVETLPLDEDVVPETRQRADMEEELSGFDRAWAAVQGAFSNLVTVRRSEERLEPLLSPEANYFLRTNIQLQLQTARLALLQREPAIFRQSLDDVEGWLRRYFDTDDKAVSGAIETVAEIRDSEITREALPDVSGSLRAFRQQRARTEGAE
jgi:uroporphyrin-3 C-methyltransferase